MDNAGKGLLSDIDTLGWSVIMVPEDNDGPAFAYTVGLYHTFNHPEILMAGLEIEFMNTLLNDLGQDVSNGISYEAGKQYSGVIETFFCSFQTIDEKFYQDYLGTALSFYKDLSFPALQCVYPDMSGRYLWEPDVNPALVEMQPLLSAAVLTE